MTDSLRILAFEPYDTGSHRAVRQSIERHSRFDWTWRTLPGRAWKWRMRLAAAEMVDQARADGVLDHPFDLVFATSLMSASDLRALLPAHLRTVPLVLYMHENQAAYPDRHGEHVRPDSRDVHFALTNLTSALAADGVIWTSRSNRESFCAGIERILAHAPAMAVRTPVERVRARSTIIWPPVEPPPSDSAGELAPDRVLHKLNRVVWPHRWEHDKGVSSLKHLGETRRNLEWLILGERFGRGVPPDMARFLDAAGDRIVHAGFVEDRADYWARLASAGWVLSTANHEFFGIGVVEALLAGCLPWLPDRLSYPELVPAEWQGLDPDEPPSDPERARREIIEHLQPAVATNAVATLDAHLASVTV